MTYSANDLTTLSPGRAFREKIGMYLSADRQEAINLGLRELIVNVQDEFEVYKPEKPFLKIELFTKERKIRVSDNMRGIPCAVRDDGVNSLTAAFLLPHSGAKHKEGSYVSSVGINGEGNKVVCHTAKWLEVEVHRDGNIYFQRFESNEEGATPVSDVKISKAKDSKTGTIITYIPDEAVYGDIFINEESLKNMLREMSYFTKGLKIILIIDGEEQIFFSENGLIDGLKNENTIGKPFSYFYEGENCKVELALQWVTKKGSIKGYANGLYMPDGGVFISQFKTSLTRTFNSLAKTKFGGEQIRDCLDGFVSVKVHVGQFSNQAKTALANKEAGTATSTAISNCLKEYHMKSSGDFNKVVEILTKVAKAEIAAERARRQVLETAKDISNDKKKRKILADKLKDCQIHGPNSGSVLGICEGDSALGALVQARPIDKVALMPIRGKIISALKNPQEKILQNEEVKAIFSALGCGFLNNYNSSKLRYQYVAICSDGDVDGSSIANLITTLFFYMCPKFIKEGRLFRAKMPLFVLEYSGNKRYYAFSGEERDELIKKYGKPKSIGRKKGIGENTPQETEEAVFGEQRRWERVNIKDFEEYADMMNMLMGPKVDDRRDFIMKNVDFSNISE